MKQSDTDPHAFELDPEPPVDAPEEVKYYTSKNPPSWLEEVQVVRDKGRIWVNISPYDSRDTIVHAETPLTPEAIQASEAKLKELIGIKVRLQPADLADSLRDPEPGVKVQQVEEHFGVVRFDASPTSNIRSVLIQSGLPQDIIVPLMTDLQVMWARTPS
jgi:hypothetical protein